MKVYVATIPLYYEVMAVAATEAAAIQKVSEKAYEDLSDCGQTDSETDTPDKVADYFGVTVTALTVDGPGVCIGDR